MSPLLELRVVVPGTLAPKGSVRAVNTARGARAVHSQQSKASEHAVSAAADRALMELEPAGVVLGLRAEFDAPVAVTVTCRLPAPERVTKRRTRAERYGGPRDTRHAKRPDADKLLRTVLDGLTGVAFRDDSQVFRASIEKVYAEGPTSTEIVIAYYDLEHSRVVD